jgi:hypothetical protein
VPGIRIRTVIWSCSSGPARIGLRLAKRRSSLREGFAGPSPSFQLLCRARKPPQLGRSTKLRLVLSILWKPSFQVDGRLARLSRHQLRFDSRFFTWAQSLQQYF